MLNLQAVFVERVMAEVSIEHKRELGRARRSPEQRHAELVHRLLAGEHRDTAELGYDLDGWHLGVIATGIGAREALSGMALMEWTPVECINGGTGDISQSVAVLHIPLPVKGLHR